jgi:hypothetical protein
MIFVLWIVKLRTSWWTIVVRKTLKLTHADLPVGRHQVTVYLSVRRPERDFCAWAMQSGAGKHPVVSMNGSQVLGSNQEARPQWLARYFCSDSGSNAFMFLRRINRLCRLIHPKKPDFFFSFSLSL